MYEFLKTSPSTFSIFMVNFGKNLEHTRTHILFHEMIYTAMSLILSYYKGMNELFLINITLYKILFKKISFLFSLN